MNEQTYLGRGMEALDRQLLTAIDPYKRRLIHVQRATLFARLVRTAESKALITQLRAENQDYEPRLSSWIMYAEGLIAHFEALDTTRAMGWFRRAHAISVACGDNELRAICAAWMADSDFRSANIQSSITHALDAFRWSTPNSHEARGRACLILADLLSWADLTKEAKDWYRRSRHHAVQLGDIGMQSVILYNSVSFRTAATVLADCYDTVDVAGVEALRREVTSVSNLDAGLSIGRLTSLVPALQAELSAVLREWQRGITGLESVLDRTRADGQTRLHAKFAAQLAWCRANIGDVSGAKVATAMAREGIDECEDLDDLAVVYSRLAASAKLAGDMAEAAKLQERGDRCMSAFLEARATLNSSMIEAVASIANP